MATKNLTLHRLRDVVAYDKATGVFVWRVAASQRASVGAEAGRESQGYRVIGIDGARYLAHRLAWFHVYGDWPIGQIDHINGNKSDNRIGNLRDVSRQVNNQNIRTAQRDSRSGILGVRVEGAGFTARLKVDGKSLHIGSFRTEDEASAAYIAAKRKHHAGCTL